MLLRSLIPAGRNRAAPALSFDPLRSLQQEMDRLFEDFGRATPASRPAQIQPKMDVCETDTAIEITAEIPGLDEKAVEVRFSDGVLTISGEKKSDREQTDNGLHLVERRYGSFARAIRLPEGTDPNAIEASIEKGVLKVSVRKPEPKLAKKIDIKTAA